ncbi:sulfurtransferase [Terrihabitans sp. B22-R8]|uniref:sulfurtransferase n=1 Tax=Terrihabitans sp. B22-R8 TaxID=3425128 RepID=UPI00403D225B
MADPVIEAEYISQLDSPRLLDVRDPDVFEAGHLAGAARVPIETWIEAAKSEDTSFVNLDYWQGQFAALGLSNTDMAVIFDDGRMTEAARVWFVLQFFGANAVIVNGGWPALKQANIDGSTRPSRFGGAFVPRAGAGTVGLVDRSSLKMGLKDSAIFDARTNAEFAGTNLKNNARGGHLPGAKLLPHADLIEKGHLKSAEALRMMITATGFQPGDHIVTHCDGGGRAALAAIAAVRAGFDDVNVYYLSFSDWAKDESCPIER